MDNLYQLFNQTPREYSLRPFWFWNGELTPAEVTRQIDAMMAQGIYGAHVHNRSGLKPRYLSDAWWELVKAALEKSEQVGFNFCMCDEYNWPSGEGRDYTQPGIPSRVLANNPEYQMRSLVPERRLARGGQVETFPPLGKFDHVVAGQRGANGALDATSLRDITIEIRANGAWTIPDGYWEIFTFTLKTTIGVDGGTVDLMNPDAVRTFIDAIYEEYAQHVGEHFGKAFQATYMDHEGDYGWQLAWTPNFFESFQQIKGYDLVPMLPLLLDEGGDRTPVIRCDYFDVISTLYADSFFKQIADWARAHNIHVSGHVWEESLQAQTAFQGDHFRIQRALETPGIDSLFEWGRFPRHFKEAASVAHFRETGMTVENQGVQGMDNFLSLERVKRTTNMLAVWGTTMFIPHAINGNPDRIDFPEDWFERQPWWQHFHQYADYTSRLAYMNSGGRHVCNLLLYYPIETAWAHGDVCFDEKKWKPGFEGIDTERGQILHWNNIVDELNQVYGDIIDTLPAHHWDLDIADADYLQEAKIEDARLHIASESFGVLMIPPMTCIRRSVAVRAREFYEAGGTVIAVSRLAFDSMETGCNDPALQTEWEAIFGTEIVERAKQGALQFDWMEATTTSANNGQAFWSADVDNLLNLLQSNSEQDVRVQRGNGEGLFALHRVKDDNHFYWLVNDTDTPKSLVIDVPITGHAELWHPETGESREVFYLPRDRRTELHLWFDPWEAYYIVIDPSSTSQGNQSLTVESTNLEQYHLSHSTDGLKLHGQLPATNATAYAHLTIDGQSCEGSAAIQPQSAITLAGDWNCTPDLATTPMAHAKSRVAPRGDGLALGWQKADYNDTFWSSEWLSPERFSIRDWWILGAFEYDEHKGFNTVMPPEQGIDLTAEYDGKRGERIRWQQYHSHQRIVDLDIPLDMENERSKADRFVTAFALTHVYSTDERDVEIRCTADCNAKIWLNDELLWAERDDHQGYLELRDAFGTRVPAHLHQGWNSILLKVSQGIRFAGKYAFTLRLCDADGLALPDLRYAASPDDSLLNTVEANERWYRMQIPPGATTLELPPRPVKAVFWADGERLDSSGKQISLPAGAKTLAVCVEDDGHLPDFLQFHTGTFTTPLQSMTHTGLSFYVGQFTYTKQFTLPADYLPYQLQLDLGTVGTTAEVWLNGVKIGERVWQPFVFNISAAAREGVNDLRIVVANTASNDRARGENELQMWGVLVRGPKLLDALEENGLLGPVRIVPWVKVELACQ